MSVRKVIVSGVALAVVLAAAAFAGGAERPGGGATCSRVGTWFGLGDQGFQWIAIDDPGPNATAGQVTLEWTFLDPTLGGFFPDAAGVTSGVGVWGKLNRHLYQYTWVAYGLDAGGMWVYIARASGTAEMTDCDHVDINYVLEIFDPMQDIWTQSPAYGCFAGTAQETRMPLVQATCE